MRVLKILFILAAGFYGVAGAFYRPVFGYLSGADLLFHEAGHLLFSPFGEEVSIWGGTLTQILIPSGIMTAFLWTRRPYSASVMGCWAGQNLFSISDYIKDARAQVLPYVGGEIHDWAYILGRFRLLEKDQTIANAVWFAGLAAFLVCSAWGFSCARKGAS
jgi:hypothetical protein